VFQYIHITIEYVRERERERMRKRERKKNNKRERKRKRNEVCACVRERNLQHVACVAVAEGGQQVVHVAANVLRLVENRFLEARVWVELGHDSVTLLARESKPLREILYL
jgi:hypothetical protein